MLTKLSISIAGAAVIALGITETAQAVTFFDNRINFQNQLTTFIVDDYENPAYLEGDKFNGTNLDIHSNNSMTNVLGETQYVSTGFDNHNLIVTQGSNHQYCTGCNGSFLLDFTQTSVGTSSGIFGAGFDILAGTDYFAYVTFGNGTEQNFLLPRGFWGITSDDKVKSIHVGLINGMPTQGGYIEIDNLTIGSNGLDIPEPSSTLGLLAMSVLSISLIAKRKQENRISSK